MRSTSATFWRRSMPNSVKAAPMSRASQRWPKSPASTATAAPCCCSAKAPMGAGCRSNITPTQPSACRTTRRSPRRSTRRWPIRSRARKATSARRSSRSHAMGLMQVTPAAAIDTAKKFKAVYNRARLLSDPVYNMQMGAAELSNLLTGYNGSYLLTFAGYNAGRGRVRQWIAAYGDPRDPKVDPVDWVERIPISETRNYVARIMENLQIYRARFGGGSKLVIEADLKRGGAN